MKKLLLSFLAVTLIATAADAQHCAAATNGATPQTFAQPGLQPLSENLPCTVLGTYVSDTIYFQNFTTFSTFTVQSLKIDSINNLPPGLCWTTNVANNTFAGGASGVIVVSGTPTGPVGQYKLKLKVDVNVGILLTNQDPEALTGLRYWIRTQCPASACSALDTASPYPTFKPYTACPTSSVTASISPAGNVAICQGSSQTLTANAGTGYTYKWSTGATTQSISVTTAGSYVVTVYSAPDSAVSAATVLAVNALPTATVTPAGPDSICQGTSATLTAAANTSYLWSNQATTQSITVSTAGSYLVTVTNANNCTAVSSPVSVVIKAVTTPTITQAGYTLTASAGSAYQWYKDGNLLTNDTLSTLTATANGSYTVNVTGANGCAATSAATVVTGVGINDINGAAIVSLYPNPSEGHFTLETAGRAGDKYEIYDQVGRAIQQKTISADKMLIDMSAQSAGVYTLTVRHGSVNETIRFTVIK
jgi:hypothetical protein